MGPLGAGGTPEQPEPPVGNQAGAGDAVAQADDGTGDHARERRRETRAEDQAYELVLETFGAISGASRAILVVRDPGREPALLASWPRANVRIGRRSDPRHANETSDGVAIGSRIRTANGRMGAICASFPYLAPEDRPRLDWLADSYAAAVALCLDPKGGLDELITASRRDVLTECMSFGAVMGSLEQEVSREQRFEQGLTCTVLDLDGFKQINDQRGHLAGNKALAIAGTKLRESLRLYDSVGRFGGDEFMVVLPETDLASARAIAARMVEAISEAVHSELGVALTVSAGVAQHRKHETAADLFAAADYALLTAKRAGRGRVVVRSSRG